MRVATAIRRWILERDSGTSILEFTILAPFLFGLGLGMFEFGNLIYKYHLINVGVRDAARFLAGLPAGTPAETTCTTSNPSSTPVGCAKRLAVTAQIANPPSTSNRRVDWFDVDDITVQYTSVANDDGSGNKIYRGGATITLVTVSTSVSYGSLGFLDYLGLGPITLTSRHEERLYGVR